MKRQSGLFLLVAIMVTILPLYGIPTGNIAGLVLDAATHSPMAGANVIVVNTERGAATDIDGHFIINDVPTGTYSVEASMIGYQAQAKTSVVVEPGRTVDLVFKLSQTSIEMEVVTVRVDYFPKVKDAPVSERNFSSEEIQIQPGGLGDIQRLVQAMPAVVSSGDQDNEIIVRGGNPNENLFLLDGIEIPYPNHFGMFETQGGPINMINSLLIREVDFIAGAFPARYGGRASSVMDIALKRGSYTELEGSIDMGMAGLGAVLEFPLPGQGNSFIGSYHKSFLELMAEAGVWGISAVPYYDNALGKLTLRLSPNHELSVLGAYGNDHINLEPGEDVVDSDFWVKQRTSRFAVGIGLQTLFGNVGYSKLLLSGASTHWDQLVTWDEDRTDTLQSTVATEQAWSARYDVSLLLLPDFGGNKAETQFGVGYSHVPFEYDIYMEPDTIYNYVYDSDSTVIDSFPYLDEQGDPVVFSVDEQSKATSYKLFGYLQHKFAISTFAHLTLGGRLDYFDYTGAFDISPRAGFSTRPLVAGFSFHAGYGWHYQIPPYFILLWDSTSNHFLKSRRSDHYIVGLDRLFGNDAKLSLEVYYKNISGIPIPESWTTPDPYDASAAYVDKGKGNVRGMELFLQKKFSRNWHGTIAYSLSRSRFTNPQDETKTIPADFDYRHVFTATGTYKFEFYKQDWYQRLPGWFRASIGALIFSDEANLGFRFRYMTGRPYTPEEWIPQTRQWVDNSDLLNSDRYPDYHRLDIRWDHKFIYSSWNLSWYLEVQNVYNRKNLWMYYYEPGDEERQTVHQISRWVIAGLVIEF